VYRKQFGSAQLLIRHGSDPTAAEEFGESAYGLALLQVRGGGWIRVPLLCFADPVPHSTNVLCCCEWDA
jgi:hypothetical protein